MRIRIRVLAVFLLSCVLALYLGLADISLPHDKILHFTLFFIMSILFYWIIDSKATHTWIMIVFITCTIMGGIGSEFLQHMISPFRTFDPLDIVANACGSLLGIGLSIVYQKLYPSSKHIHHRVRRITDVEDQLDLGESIDDLSKDVPLKNIRTNQPSENPI